MLYKIKSLATQHSSLLVKHSPLFVMMSGSVCSFATNIITKKYFPAETYNWLAVYLVFIGYLGILSFFASENVFLRYCEVNDKEIFVSKKIIYQVFLSWCAALVIMPIIGNLMSIDKNINYLFYVMPFLLVSITAFLSLLNRVTGSFFVSQVMSDGWKVLFFLMIALIAFRLGTVNNSFIALAMVASVLITGLFAVYSFYSRAKITIKTSKDNIETKEILVSQYSFALSFLYFSIHGSVDKVVLNGYYDPEVFSEYLYLVSMLLSPLNIISTYISFKELVYIKNGKQIDVPKVILKTGFMGLILYFIYSILLLELNDYLSLEFDLYIWLAVMIIVMVKVPYSILKAIMEAKGSARDLKIINHASFIFLIVICFIIVMYKDLYITRYLIALLWVSRFIMYYFKSLDYVQQQDC